MNRKNLMLLFASVAVIMLGCGKDKTPEDPHTHSLLNKSLDEIRTEIAGKWQVQRAFSNGVAGPQPTYIPPGQGDIYRFLPNDTVKQTSYNDYTIYLYEKAMITKQTQTDYDNTIGPVYTFSFSNFLVFPMVMQELKNDTLIIKSGVPSQPAGRDYLIRIP